VNEVVRGGGAVQPTSTALSVLTEPLVAVTPALRLYEDMRPDFRYRVAVASFEGARDLQCERLKYFLMVDEARGQLSRALRERLTPGFAAAVVGFVYNVLANKSDNAAALLDATLAVLGASADDLAAALGDEVVDATPASLAIAAHKLLRGSVFPPKPAEWVQACREADEKLEKARSFFDDWIEDLCEADLKVLAADPDAWRAQHERYGSLDEMLQNHMMTLDPYDEECEGDPKLKQILRVECDRIMPEIEPPGSGE
jgi:hypothetical protein